MNGSMAEPTQLDILKRKLAARENVPAYAENVAHLRSEIAKLERGGASEVEGN